MGHEIVESFNQPTGAQFSLKTSVFPDQPQMPDALPPFLGESGGKLIKLICIYIGERGKEKDKMKGISPEELGRSFFMPPLHEIPTTSEKAFPLFLCMLHVCVSVLGNEMSRRAFVEPASPGWIGRVSDKGWRLVSYNGGH